MRTIVCHFKAKELSDETLCHYHDYQPVSLVCKQNKGYIFFFVCLFDWTVREEEQSINWTLASRSENNPCICFGIWNYGNIPHNYGSIQYTLITIHLNK